VTACQHRRPGTIPRTLSSPGPQDREHAAAGHPARLRGHAIRAPRAQTGVTGACTDGRTHAGPRRQAPGGGAQLRGIAACRGRLVAEGAACASGFAARFRRRWPGGARTDRCGGSARPVPRRSWPVPGRDRDRPAYSGQFAELLMGQVADPDDQVPSYRTSLTCLGRSRGSGSLCRCAAAIAPGSIAAAGWVPADATGTWPGRRGC
jgi:hypothetical protein